MALTQADKSELLNAIKAESRSVDELTPVTSLDGVNSLPAIRGTEVVNVPISLLRKPAEDAAKTANAAASAANTAANTANTAAGTANSAAAVAGRAAEKASAAADTATGAAGQLMSVIAEARRHPVLLVNDLIGDYSRQFASWVEAKDAIANNDDIGGENLFSCGCVMIFKGQKKWEAWLFTGDPESEISAADKWEEFSTAGGSGSGFYNLTEQQPLTTGYYTKDSAVAALANVEIDDEQKRGMIITFEASPGKWADYRFIGTTLDTFLSPGAWEEYGSKNTVRQITVNGDKKLPDAEGNVDITIDKVEVDDSLDPDSTNPVQNGAVAAKVAELESGTLFGSDVVENDDGTVTVQLSGKSSVITEFTIPAGGGGGGDDTSTTKIVLSAALDKKTIKEGDPVLLTWIYDHQYSGGDDKGQSTGQKAAVQITVRRGTTVTYSDTKQDVAAGTYTLDLTKYLLLGTSDIYVVATATDPNTGKQQRKQAYISVKVVTLTLSSSYNISNGIAQGGFDTGDTIEIPYSVNGSGTKSVALYVDGKQRNLHSVTRSGTTNDTFRLAMSGLTVGRHTVQMVAEMEQDGLTLKSESAD